MKLYSTDIRVLAQLVKLFEEPLCFIDLAITIRMKILRKNDGPLTNFEVLDFLRSRGATSDPMGCLGAVATSECKVFEYLVQSPAGSQTREHIDEFLRQCEGFDLAPAEKLNIINLRPSTQPEIYPIIELCDKRFPSNENCESRVEELVQIAVKVLPPPLVSEEEEEEETASQEETTNEKDTE